MPVVELSTGEKGVDGLALPSEEWSDFSVAPRHSGRVTAIAAMAA